MTVRVRLQHATRYRYDRPVRLGPHEIRLKPVADCRTPVDSYSFTVRPEPLSTYWYQDASGNHVARALFHEPTAGLEIGVELRADIVPVNPFEFLVDPSAARFPPAYPEPDRRELAPLLAVAEDGRQLRNWLEQFQTAERPDGRDSVELLVRINERLKQDIAYIERPEHGVQSCDETLRLQRGSCRDSAWLLTQILRHLGFAARFVSGYLIHLGRADSGGRDTDRADLHAWTEVYLPGAGWIGLDPTSALLAAETHIALARAGAPDLAAPVVGSHEPCRSQMEFSMSLQRVV